MMCKKDEFARNQLAKYKIFYLDSIRIEYLNDINGIRFYNKKEISVKEYKLYTSLSYLIRQVFDDKNDIDRIESFLHQINKNVKEIYRIDSN